LEFSFIIFFGKHSFFTRHRYLFFSLDLSSFTIIVFLII
jgi:hypothetical protein